MNSKWPTYTRPRTKNRRADVLVALAAAVVVVLLLAGTSYAAKPSVAPSIALATVNGESPTSPSAVPSLGDWVTFRSAYPTNVKNPRIEVLCFQGGSLTFGMAGSVDYSFQLGGAGSTWLTNGGEADCTANLFYFGWKAGKQTYNWLASTSFHADG